MRFEILCHKQCYRASTRQPCYSNSDKVKIWYLCTICKSSACNKNLRNTVGDIEEGMDCTTYNEVSTIKFLPDKCDMSPCVTLHVQALVTSPDCIANRFATLGRIAVKSSITLTSSEMPGIRTVRQEVWRAVRTTAAGRRVASFCSPLLILSHCLRADPCLFERSHWRSLHWSCCYTSWVVFMIRNCIHCLKLGSLSCHTSSKGFPSTCYLPHPMAQCLSWYNWPLSCPLILLWRMFHT